jgi:CheY-like chemotaxis protein
VRKKGYLVARILIVEDEPLIAMMLEEWMIDLGHIAVGPAASVSSALALIGLEKCDAAILDFNLRGETSESIASELSNQNIPYAFASGDSGLERNPNFQNKPMLPKPYLFETVSKILTQLLGPNV